ncbi:MAG: MATE family efflux transporter [Glaciecola sp.]|nr:MATE family efflux transporter [Glaciecola sp.]
MPFNTPLYRLELKQVLTIAWPLLIAQLTQIGMGVADTIMAGQYSALDMASVAVGFSVMSPILFFIQGVALGLVPVVSNLLGCRSEQFIAVQAQHMVLILLCISVVFINVYWFIDSILLWFDVPANMQPITRDYIVYMLFALPGFAIYQAVRQTCEGLSMTRPTMVIMFIGLLVNIPANAVFIYGWFGLPQMGGAGCGLATMLVYLVMAAATIIYTIYAKQIQQFHLFTQFIRFEWYITWELLRIGIPIALTFLTEVTLFAAVAILLSPLGHLQVAAHQIAINFSSVVFMLPLSIAMAVAIRVSYLMGQGKGQDTIITIRAARWFTVLCACVTASLTVYFAHYIISVYTEDDAVTKYALPILFLAALFQISDAVQVISANALRGYKDTTWMLGMCIISYWLLGLPLGVILGLTDYWVPAMEAQGLWIGIIIGLSVAALLLHFRMKYFQRSL